ncbi:MAG: precorrin-6y C5,15-methyltransferase (decarboxylating) subunit CbiE [Lachnospiraceae bacterium]|nr:precorrin-6y C5,15-methyltransferase (decarboxylating) subunit CbiE [Lachnospiraceae bacterium]MCM1279466.1 precorrin-6y C5,15-methyltransferase (decarboxylating) subunit CbiE [Robinsoniella sp.]
MKQVSIIGTGMGTEATLTIEGKREIEQAKLLIGAKRVLAGFSRESGKEFLEEYKEEAVLEAIWQSKADRIAVLMSGDVGFYSGAKRLYPLLKESCQVRLIPGISSLSYFSARLGISWEDAAIISIHGRRENVLQAVKGNTKLFLLGGGSFHETIKELVDGGMGEKRAYIGENLSYETEKISTGTLQELSQKEYEPLSVMLILNEQPECKMPYGIPEESFVRGNVPITKSEVRAVAMSKLAVANHEILYDIGAGTGSVSVEMALAAFGGRVYAIEGKEEAISLIKENKRKFGLANLEIIEGMAPKAMEPLEKPHAAFIGGSSGKIDEIIKLLLHKNPHVRIVLSAIAIETVGKVLELCRELSISKVEIVQVAVSKAREMGNVHMLMGQNPIYIITINA